MTEFVVDNDSLCSHCLFRDGVTYKVPNTVTLSKITDEIGTNYMDGHKFQYITCVKMHIECKK